MHLEAQRLPRARNDDRLSLIGTACQKSRSGPKVRSGLPHQWVEWCSDSTRLETGEMYLATQVMVATATCSLPACPGFLASRPARQTLSHCKQSSRQVCLRQDFTRLRLVPVPTHLPHLALPLPAPLPPRSRRQPMLRRRLRHMRRGLQQFSRRRSSPRLRRCPPHGRRCLRRSCEMHSTRQSSETL